MEPTDPKQPAPDSPAGHDAAQRFDEVLRRLEAEPPERLPMEELARLADLSPFHFHRVFRGIMGETVRGYARRVRLERAAERLTGEADSVLEIALDAGYAGPEAFARAFKRQFGRSPSEYREGIGRPFVPAESVPPPIRVEQAPAVTVARVRHVGPYAEVGDAWKALMRWGWTRMVFRTPATFGMCHDDPDVAAPAALRYDACMVVSPRTKARAGVEIASLPAATYVVTEHRGPYAELGEAYGALCGEVETRPIGGVRYALGEPPSRELYLNDPRKTDPEDLRTEVWMPVVAR